MELNHYGYANHCHHGLTHLIKVIRYWSCFILSIGLAGLAGLAPALDPLKRNFLFTLVTHRFKVVAWLYVVACFVIFIMIKIGQLIRLFIW
jgi:hypothetical protein